MRLPWWSSSKGVRIYTCKEWGAKPVDVQFARRPAAGLVIHHTASPSRKPLTGAAEEKAACSLARGIQRLHRRQNGWADTGQHFLVSRGGLILEGRHGSDMWARQGLVPRGAHAGANGPNATHFGIEIEGRYDRKDDLPAVQWDALVELCAHLCLWGNVQSQDIFPHCDYTATACPGKLADRLPALRQAVHDRKLTLAKELHG